MRTWLAVVIPVVVAASCAHGGEPAHSAETAKQVAAIRRDAEAGNRQQQEALRDGRVTQAEMDEAMDNFRTCLRGKDLDLIHPIIDPFRGPPVYMYLAGRPASDPRMVPSGAIQSCATETMSFVDAAAQLARTSRVDDAVRTRAQACLRSKDVDVSDADTSVESMRDTAGPSHVATVNSCLYDAVFEVYPDVDPVVLIGP